jgi:hypothetical protein
MRYHEDMSRTTKRLLINLAIVLLIVGIYRLYPSLTTHTTPTPRATTSSSAGTIVPEQTAQCHMNGELPDTSCTPGVANPDVTQANINQTICVPGYTKTIRPAASYTDALKTQQMQQYGFTDSIHVHEEDHLISLELGGAPSDPKNLWPEPHASPNPKDAIENFLHSTVCKGQITLQEAQTRIAHDWTTAEQGL